MDCGGKRSATPLWMFHHSAHEESTALSPLRSASALPTPAAWRDIDFLAQGTDNSAMNWLHGSLLSALFAGFSKKK